MIGAVYLSCCLSAVTVAAGHQRVRFVRAIVLDGIEERIDHVAVDQQGQRLFVAALGNGTVEVVDLPSGRRIRKLRYV